MQFKIRNEIDGIYVDNISRDLGLPSNIIKILYGRGYKTKEEITSFLKPSMADFHDPFLFHDMEKAVCLIRDAINKKDKIVVWGDFDCDGAMSTSILASVLISLGGKVNCYIPDRHAEGYGLNKNGIYKIYQEKNCRLLITVDCGISNFEEVEYARSLGMKVIVTDHHEPPQKLPSCEAILDAKVEGEVYPFKELCGAGVAGKIAQALIGKNAIKQYADLMALATVADLVPLVGENRAIVKAGLSLMNSNPRPGIDGLSQYAKSKDSNITSYMLGFSYAPMINACGRLGHASDCVNLMLTGNSQTIQSLSKKLYDYNESRKRIENELYEQCLSQINESEQHKSLILYGDSWEIGVIGIVASKLLEKFNCPVIVFSYDAAKKEYRGSGRSIPGINLFKLIEKCSEYTIKFGGHEQAAGLTVAEEDFENFKLSFERNILKFDDSLFDEVKKYDEVIELKNIDKRLISYVEAFEPTGMGNPRPLFLLKNVNLKKIEERGSEGKHFSCCVYDQDRTRKAIAFNQKRPKKYTGLDIICSPHVDCFNNIEFIKIQIHAIKENEEQKQRDIRNKFTIYGVRTIPQPLAVLNITEKKIKQFEKNNIFTIQDLVDYLPKKYLDFREPKTVREAADKELCSIIGMIKYVKSSQKMVYAMCEDREHNRFMACWFHQDYVARTLFEGQIYNFCGTVKIQEGGFLQIYPTYWSKDTEKLKALIPVYKKIPGMSVDYLSSTIEKALALVANTDYLDEDIVTRFNLISEYDSYFYLHKPKSDIDVELGQRRKIFDALFKFNFILKDKLNVSDFVSSYKVKNNKIWTKIKERLSFSLTNDQEAAINGMFDFVKAGNRLNGLVQGDVGSGKTIVAFLMMALGIENNFQSCIVAPTEVLAKQHYEELCSIMKPLGINVGYLTGSMKAKEKREQLKNISDGTSKLVAGTHAILQDGVNFKTLGLVVIDEQHKFGVKQRERLLSLPTKPHMITMSATPIPRTLSMALYGDNIQVYNIKTKPAGRKDVITLKMYNDSDVNEFMLKEIKKGHQCYVVCPIIEDSTSDTMSDVLSVRSVADEIKNYFMGNEDVKISDISGKMKQADINEEIRKFTNLETNILISTTIIEVGVNVPNATVMVIKSSERFGLAQAHQLRGRVGRGNEQAYCILQTNKDDRKAEIMCETSDGFEIAKQDLLLRGSGDYIGTQQTGNNKNVMLMLAEPYLYRQISEVNDNIFATPHLFARYKYIIDEFKED